MAAQFSSFCSLVVSVLFKFPAGPNYITIVNNKFNELFVYSYDGVLGNIDELIDELFFKAAKPDERNKTVINHALPQGIVVT